MADTIRAQVQTVPVGIDLSSALADWLVGKYQNDRLGLADVLLFLPNNRAISALTAAFVRSAEKGLILPRMVAIGDLALDEKIGPLLDPLSSAGQATPPAIAATDRLLNLVHLVRQYRSDASAAEALHLSKQLMQTLDELEIEEKSLLDSQFDHENSDLATHWATAYDRLKAIYTDHAGWLDKQGMLAPAKRRNVLLQHLALRMKSDPPSSLVVAAGITTAAPAIARLLAQIAKLPNGLVVLPHLDLTLKDEEWEALADFSTKADDEGAVRPLPHQETHPQYHLKLLLHRMGVQRSEVSRFTEKPAGHRAPALAQMVQDIFCISDNTVQWQDLSPQRRQLGHVRLIESEDSAEEARAISVLIREAVEVPGKRIALVTPDREIAQRVAAQLRRWNIEADDSAGEALAADPVGILFLSVSQLLAQDCAPIALLSVLKHPLIRSGEQRLEWLESVRALDLCLRGPQLRSGPDAITDILSGKDKDGSSDPELLRWWNGLCEEIKSALELGRRHLSTHIDAVTSLMDSWSDGEVWKGSAGRRLAEFVEELTRLDLDALSDRDATAYPEILKSLLADISLRPAFGKHPRVAIYGLLEARLQSADLLICAGLNEGSWPQLPQPDPWLAPHLRRQLGLAGLDRNIGLSAHDLASALGADEVVLTRARRDRSGPTIASRFLLRMQALFGDQLQVDQRTARLAQWLDKPANPVAFHPRPAPSPSKAQRTVAISITQMDMLKADPYAFYARNILKLDALKPVDADPDPAWKGTLVHKIIEDWTESGAREPDSLVDYARATFADRSVTPALKLLWQPRILAGLRWVASEIASNIANGRSIVAHEIRAEGEICGIRIHGRIDRIDSLDDGRLAIVDYKTGGPPAKGKVNAGFALQLGLAGLLVETGGVKGITGEVGRYEYWSLAKKDGAFGYAAEPFAKSPKAGEPTAETFVSFADEHAGEAIGKWISGSEPFTAKLKPDYAIYQDYDQLMRLREWVGRENWIGDGNDT